jgi:hypothetical protein
MSNESNGGWMTKRIFVATAVFIFALVAIFAVSDVFIEPAASREPASVPSNYTALSACEKQDVLWSHIQQTKYTKLPAYRTLGLLQALAMGRQEVSIKGSHYHDFAPVGWRKFLHGRASIAKVKIVPVENKYSGLFQGADCGLLRLSLTSAVAGPRPVAPGLALKVLLDGVESVNVSALVSLDGQGHDFNFFKYPYSNIVPVGEALGQKLVHRIFLSASPYPEELKAQEFAEVDQRGNKVANVVTPRQLFFIPQDLGFSSKEHEVRDDFAKIPVNTALFEIRAAPDKYNNFNYGDYTPEMVSEFLKESIPVAHIVTTSEFIASAFGDDGIFFRHQFRNKKE